MLFKGWVKSSYVLIEYVCTLCMQDEENIYMVPGVDVGTLYSQLDQFKTQKLRRDKIGYEFNSKDSKACMRSTSNAYGPTVCKPCM